MARDPAPWYWHARKGWYAWVGGRRLLLCKGPNRATPPAAAWARLAEMRDATTRGRMPTVGALCLDYLDDAAARVARGELTADVARAYRGRLRRFCAHDGPDGPAGDLRCDELRPHHVTAWLDAGGFNPTSRHDNAETVRGVFRWGVRRGHLDADPLARLERQGRKLRRGTPPSAADLDRIEAAIDPTTPGLRDLVRLMRLTGARPGELARMTAADVADGVVVLREHKTAHHHGEPREIYLPPEAAEIVARLCRERPEGPLILTRRGTAYTPSALGASFAKAARRAGVEGVTIYAIRHRFGTDLAHRADIPLAVTARLMGHRDIKTTQTYIHADDSAMRAAAGKITSPPANPGPGPDPDPPAGEGAGSPPTGAGGPVGGPGPGGST